MWLGGWERVSSFKTAGESTKKALALSIRKWGVGLVVKSDLGIHEEPGAQEEEVP